MVTHFVGKEVKRERERERARERGVLGLERRGSGVITKQKLMMDSSQPLNLLFNSKPSRLFVWLSSPPPSYGGDLSETLIFGELFLLLLLHLLLLQSKFPKINIFEFWILICVKKPLFLNFETAFSLFSALLNALFGWWESAGKRRRRNLYTNFLKKKQFNSTKSVN